MEKQNKYHFAREIIFNLRSCHAINERVYLHWIDKLIKDEDIDYARCSTELKEKEVLSFKEYRNKLFKEQSIGLCVSKRTGSLYYVSEVREMYSEYLQNL